jgi:hypothetical protein
MVEHHLPDEEGGTIRDVGPDDGIRMLDPEVLDDKNPGGGSKPQPGAAPEQPPAQGG